MANNKGNIKALHYWPFVRGIHWLPVDSPHKGPVMLKVFPRHDIITVPSIYHMLHVPVFADDFAIWNKYFLHRKLSHHDANFIISGVTGGCQWWLSWHGDHSKLIVRRAGLLWSQQDFEWRWSVPLFKCLTVLEFSFISFDLCLLITFFNFIMNYVPIVTFWIFTYHKIWILSIMFCFIWSYWIIYFLASLEVSWRVVS